MASDAERARLYRERHPGRAEASTRRWCEANPDKVKANWLKQSRTNYQKNRLHRYGVTPGWFRDQLVGQAGRCAICWTVFKSNRDTHIDHDHATGRVRALLCANCNLMIGHARESVAILSKAISYLDRGVNTDGV